MVLTKNYTSPRNTLQTLSVGSMSDSLSFCQTMWKDYWLELYQSHHRHHFDDIG
jgi:hypothetical protein